MRGQLLDGVALHDDACSPAAARPLRGRAGRPALEPDESGGGLLRSRTPRARALRAGRCRFSGGLRPAHGRGTRSAPVEADPGRTALVPPEDVHFIKAHSERDNVVDLQIAGHALPVDVILQVIGNLRRFLGQFLREVSDG